MKQGVDYVLVDQANTINYQNFTKQIKCTFIGTKNFFFAIPFSTGEFVPGVTKDTVTKTEMYYKGIPLQDFLIQKCEDPNLSVSELEQFLIDEKFPETNIVDIENDIAKFKIQANFWGTGIMYNKSAEGMGWKIILNRFKKDKVALLDFYSNHPKRVQK